MGSICTSGHRVQCVLGPAGSGKTFALATAVVAWEEAGYRPIGAVVQGTATEVLRALGDGLLEGGSEAGRLFRASALGGIRTHNLLIRSQARPSEKVRRRPPLSAFSLVIAL